MINLTTAAGIFRRFNCDFTVKMGVSKTYIEFQRTGGAGDGVSACYALRQAGANPSYGGYMAQIELESLT